MTMDPDGHARGDTDGAGRPKPRAAAAVVAGFVAGIAVVASGCPAPTADDHGAAPLPRRTVQAVADGVRAAQACEAQLDDDLKSYVACIESGLRAFQGDPTRKAGLRFQAWVMADLAVQQSTPGAIDARVRWWRGLQGDLTAARLTVDDLCHTRGLDPVDVRRRASRQAAGG